MCTVTYIKHNNQYFFTSNRDENINRQSALHPQKKAVGDYHLYYPVDPQGSGTWFCVKNNGTVCILLNGAHKKHISNGAYRKSRGLVLMELIMKKHMRSGWEELNLENIEPFTIIAFSNGLLNQFRWDGIEKENVELNPDEAHIWSSATLYSDDFIVERKRLFKAFLKDNNLYLDDNKIMSFHAASKKENAEKEFDKSESDNGIIITKNITQCVLTEIEFTLSHLDLITAQKTIVKNEIVVA